MYRKDYRNREYSEPDRMHAPAGSADPIRSEDCMNYQGRFVCPNRLKMKQRPCFDTKAEQKPVPEIVKKGFLQAVSANPFIM